MSYLFDGYYTFTKLDVFWMFGPWTQWDALLIFFSVAQCMQCMTVTKIIFTSRRLGHKLVSVLFQKTFVTFGFCTWVI